MPRTILPPAASAWPLASQKPPAPRATTSLRLLCKRPAAPDLGRVSASNHPASSEALLRSACPFKAALASECPPNGGISAVQVHVGALALPAPALEGSKSAPEVVPDCAECAIPAAMVVSGIGSGAGGTRGDSIMA
eukprot:scaffold18400_cov31-Tisochrysis_lutea.AAC.2